MSQPGDHPIGSGSNGAAFTIISEIVVAAVIFLFVAGVFVFFLYLYAKHYMSSSRRRSRARVVFASEQLPLPRRGLDPEVLKALPVTVFRPAEFKDGLECAVCLSELSDGEKALVLSKCNHGFHLDCINMWFHSHSTCPLCRSPVGTEPFVNPNSGAELAEIPPLGAVSDDGYLRESPNFPTNVLFWGIPNRVSIGGLATEAGPPPQAVSSSSSLVIEIPRPVVEGFPSPISPLPSSSFPAEEMKLPMEEMKSPKSPRLRSLRRLLSQGKRAIGSSCSPRGGDIEQGLVGCGGTSGEGSSLAPKKNPTSS